MVVGYYATPQNMILPAGAKAKSVQSGLGTTVLLSNNGEMYTVGNSSNSQLGDGTTINSATPTAIPYVNVLPYLFFRSSQVPATAKLTHVGP